MVSLEAVVSGVIVFACMLLFPFVTFFFHIFGMPLFMLCCVYMLLLIFGTFSREPCIFLRRLLLCVRCVLRVAVYFGTVSKDAYMFFDTVVHALLLSACVVCFFQTTACNFFLMPRCIAPVAPFTATHNCTHIPSHEIDAQQNIELFA